MFRRAECTRGGCVCGESQPAQPGNEEGPAVRAGQADTRPLVVRDVTVTCVAVTVSPSGSVCTPGGVGSPASGCLLGESVVRPGLLGPSGSGGSAPVGE